MNENSNKIENNENDFLSLKDIYTYVYRFKYLIFLILILSVVASYFYTKKQPKIYKATASIVINFRDNTPIQEIKDYSYSSFKEYDAFYNTEFERLKSKNLIQTLVDNYNLPNSEFFKKLIQKQQMNKNNNNKPLDISSVVLSMLDITPIEDTNKVLISIIGQDKKFITELANYYVDNYIIYNKKRKTDHLKKSIVWLEQRVGEANTSVIDAENNLFKFKNKNKVILTLSEDKRNNIIQKIYSLDEKYNEMKLKRIEKEREFFFLKKIKDLNNYEQFNNQENVKELKRILLDKKNILEDLKEKYNEETPKILSINKQIDNIKSSIKELEKNYRNQVENSYKLILSKEKVLKGLKDEALLSALDIEKNELVYKQNRRRADSETDVYKMLLKDLKKSNLKLLLQTNNVEILDYAQEPSIPIKPNLKLNLVISVFLGMILSFMIVFLLIYLDQTIKTKEEIQDKYNVTFLGSLPKINNVKIKKEEYKDYNEIITIHDPRGNFSENCRTISTNIELINENKKIMFLVTSSSPMEGKTTIAANLASSMAEQGLKTLLIDTDLRKPRVHKVFKVDNKIGLTLYTSNNKTINEIIMKTKINNLDIITSGIIPPNALQILNGSKFDALINDLQKRYDRIIFDTPPISIVSDALIISKKVDGVVLVARYGKTNKNIFKESRDKFLFAKSKIIGIVLNQASATDSYKYNKYGKYYSYYYGERED
jgi:capsular exopolysaccharide synthesis family protein